MPTRPPPITIASKLRITFARLPGQLCRDDHRARRPRQKAECGDIAAMREDQGRETKETVPMARPMQYKPTRKAPWFLRDQAMTRRMYWGLRMLLSLAVLTAPMLSGGADAKTFR